MNETSERFTNLYNKYHKDIVMFAKKFTYEINSAEDIAQQVFIKLYNYLDSVELNKERAWLHTVCRNDCLKFIRKRSKIVDKPSAEEVYASSTLTSEDSTEFNPQESLDRKECYKIVQNLLKNLTKKQRDTIKLRFYSDLDYISIGKKLKISNGNVGFILSTMMKSMRKNLLEALAK